MVGTVQNELIHLYKLNSTNGLNKHTLDGILRIPLKMYTFMPAEHLTEIPDLTHQADDTYSIRSTWSRYWPYQFLTLALNTLILSVFYISVDLSTIYFAHFSVC